MRKDQSTSVQQRIQPLKWPYFFHIVRYQDNGHLHRGVSPMKDICFFNLLCVKNLNNNSSHLVSFHRFCTRVNISRDDPQYLSLFIHLVQGEHDDILPWPFVGKIRFTALNTSSHLNIQDEIQSDGNFDSFKRPLNFFLNKKAFGFNNFMRISDVVAPNSGYLMEDETLVIRTQVSEL